MGTLARNELTSKENQAMKLYQLIDYNMRTLFLKNLTQNMVEKLFPSPFLKITLAIYLAQQSNIL